MSYMRTRNVIGNAIYDEALSLGNVTYLDVIDVTIGWSEVAEGSTSQSTTA